MISRIISEIPIKVKQYFQIKHIFEDCKFLQEGSVECLFLIPSSETKDGGARELTHGCVTERQEL